MVRKVLILLVVLAMGGFFLVLYSGYAPGGELGTIAAHYAAEGAEELGSANLVTAVVVTYRGLDTLGEVVVLFVVAAVLGFLLRNQADDHFHRGKPPSEILCTGAALLTPLVLLLGVFIFMHGHLTPGGGFQGGAVMAIAALLSIMAQPHKKGAKTFLHLVESFSGLTYLALGILGIFWAGGFLDNRILAIGTPGKLLSAGAIPFIYALIGLKVGAELAGVLYGLRGHPRSAVEDSHG